MWASSTRKSFANLDFNFSVLICKILTGSCISPATITSCTVTLSDPVIFKDPKGIGSVNNPTNTRVTAPPIFNTRFLNTARSSRTGVEDCISPELDGWFCLSSIDNSFCSI